jgi:hypothetical protein
MISVQPSPSGFDERLDRIMKEIDELRSEIRRQRSGVQTVDFIADPPSADDAGVLNNQAWNIAISDGASPDEAKRAVELARKACEKSDWKNGYFLDTLAAAYARLGHYDEAVKWQEKALEAGNLGSETEPGQARLRLYQEKKPYNGNQSNSAPVAK